MGGELTIREAGKGDLDFIMDAERDPEASPFITVRDRDEHLRTLEAEDRELLVIERSGEPVGFALLTDLTKASRSIEIFTLVITERGQGIGRMALRLLLDRCFDSHGAHRVWLDALRANERAQRTYEGFGFVHEGELREVWPNEDGSWDSLILYSLLEREWRDLRDVSG